MKRNLVLLHGALGSKKQFDFIIEDLNKDFNVYSLNFEGHGGLISIDNFSIELFSNNVHEFMNENSLKSAHIFGYSMGGYVGLQLAIKHAKMVESIITLGTKFEWNKESAANEVKMLNPSKIKEKVPQFAIKLAKEHYPSDWELNMNKTAKMMIDMGNGARIDENEFKKIEQNVTIGLGDQDKMVSYEESKNIANLLPKSTLKKIEGVKHSIESIDASTIIDLIKSSFLTS